MHYILGINIWIIVGFIVVLIGGLVPMRIAGLRRESGMFIALIVLCFLLFYNNPDFLGQTNVVNTTRQISMLGILAVGIGFVIVTGGIDLSIGSLIGLTGVIIAKLSSTNQGGMGLSLWIGIPVAIAVVTLIGLIQGTIITRLGLQPFIVTLGFMLTLRGVSQTIADSGTISLYGSPLGKLADGGLITVNGQPILPYPLLIFLAVILVGGYLLHFTVFGRHVYAIGGNRDAAEYSGINVKAVETSTYVISAFLAGVAGVCQASYITQMSHNVGIAYELFAIAAAVLGGISLRGGEGSMVGIVIGAAVMKVIENGINMFQYYAVDEFGIRRIKSIDSKWTFVIVGMVILIAVILDQVVHIVQARRRTRRAATPAPAAPA